MKKLDSTQKWESKKKKRQPKKRGVPWRFHGRHRRRIYIYLHRRRKQHGMTANRKITGCRPKARSMPRHQHKLPTKILASHHLGSHPGLTWIRAGSNRPAPMASASGLPSRAPRTFSRSSCEMFTWRSIAGKPSKDKKRRVEMNSRDRHARLCAVVEELILLLPQVVILV